MRPCLFPPAQGDFTEVGFGDFLIGQPQGRPVGSLKSTPRLYPTVTPSRARISGRTLTAWLVDERSGSTLLKINPGMDASLGAPYTYQVIERDWYIFAIYY